MPVTVVNSDPQPTGVFVLGLKPLELSDTCSASPAEKRVVAHVLASRRHRTGSTPIELSKEDKARLRKHTDECRQCRTALGYPDF